MIMNIDSDVDSFVSQSVHPNTPNPYNIPSGPSTSPSPSTSAEPTTNEPRICSVRGCSLPLALGAINKMCEACRGRHRVYASTKRARRKMEKAAVQGIRRIGEQLNSENSGFGAATSVPSAASTTADAAALMWGKAAIDPRLYAESSASNVTHLSVYQNTTYPKGSSSELAGALTLPTFTAGASPSTPSVMHPLQPTAEINIDHPSNNGEDDSVSESGSEFENQEEREVSTTLQYASPAETSGVVEDTGQIAPDTGPSRFCSVKGCKLVIPSNYTFKMCPSCRTRYRTYGNTKRAKWKAEREAFDRELAGLRTKEDERRRQAGERSLSESPEDLCAWELSIIDEQIPLSPSVASAPAVGTHGGPVLDDATESLGVDGVPDSNQDGNVIAKPEMYADQSSVGLIRTRIPILPPSAVLPQPMNMDASQSSSPYTNFKNPMLMSALPLPSRMCTVSHCHKVLPGFYRYKRCEQHRLQNRHHSKLKRVREKDIKAIGPNGEELERTDDEGEENEKSEKENKIRTQWEKKSKIEDADGDPEFDHDAKDGNKLRKRNFTCVSGGCHNLLGPGVRWRHCEMCRARERVLKRERKELESEEKKETEEGDRNAQKEVERLREIVKRMAAGEKVDEVILGPEMRPSRGGQGQRYDEGRGESTDMLVDPDSVSTTIQETSVSKEATTSTAIAVDTPTTTSSVVLTTSANTSSPLIRPSTSKESPETFQSVFRATPVPFMFTPINNTKGSSDVVKTLSDSAVSSVGGAQKNASSVNTFGGVNPSNASRTSGKPLMFASTDTPLTFRAYKPKTATSAVGRLLGQNPELSVQVFKDLLLPGKEKQVNTGLVGSSSYHVYKSTPPPAKEAAIFVPTIPTTPPFVYQPTQKQRTYATNGDTGATQSTEARPIQESNLGTSDRRADDGANSSSSSTVANAAASGSGRPSAVPQPSTTPAPASETTPPSSAMSRKRANRAKSKPTPPLPPPPPPFMPSHYPYAPHSQYLYPYYVPAPYSMSPYGPHASSLSSATHAPLPSSISSSSSSSAYPPYAALPGAYPYPYPPYGYPSSHLPPPNYPYLPPRYIPSLYGPPPPQPDQSYVSQQLQPATYLPQYAYPKDTNFSYYHHPPESPMAEVSSSKKKRKREQGAGRGRPPSPAVVPPVVAEQPPPEQLPPAAPLVNDDTRVGHSAQDGGGDIILGETNQQAGAVSAAAAQTRQCGNRTCTRTISHDAAGAMCDKCRTRLKKRQAKAKQRFRLEPRKSILNMREEKKGDDDTNS